jgi:uncharacterized membrane protein YbhN (UPF0104 family)
VTQPASRSPTQASPRVQPSPLVNPGTLLASAQVSVVEVVPAASLVTSEPAVAAVSALPALPGRPAGPAGPAVSAAPVAEAPPSVLALDAARPPVEAVEPEALAMPADQGAAEAAEASRRRRVPISLMLAVIAPLAAAGWLALHWSSVSSGVSALRAASPIWLAAAAGAALLTWVAGAISQQGSVTRRLPTGLLLAVQVAGSFANHILPAGVGVSAVQTRFLRRHGLDLPDALGAVALNTTAGVLAHLAALALLLGFGRAPMPSVGLGSRLPWVILAAVVLVAGGLAVPAARRAVIRFAARAREQVGALRNVLVRPARAVMLWGGSLAVPTLHALTLAAVARALHMPLSTREVFVIYFAASAVAAVVPSPGGFGSLDAALTLALAGAGVATPAALAAVLGYRLITTWLPLAPSACLLAALLRRRLL